MPVFPPLTLSVSEAALFLGVSTRTVRRALTNGALISTVVSDRYFITLPHLLTFAFSHKNIENKLKTRGFGRYVEKWRV